MQLLTSKMAKWCMYKWDVQLVIYMVGISVKQGVVSKGVFCFLYLKVSKRFLYLIRCSKSCSNLYGRTRQPNLIRVQSELNPNSIMFLEVEPG